MQVTFAMLDGGDWKTPSKWAGVIKTNKGVESFDYTMGPAHRKIVHRPFGGGVRMPKGWRVGERVPFVLGRMTYDQRYVLHNCTQAIEPSQDDFLSCISRDADCVRHGQSFEEFADEFGYDEDSRAAERIYNACRETWRKLVRLGINCDALTEQYLDY